MADQTKSSESCLARWMRYAQVGMAEIGSDAKRHPFGVLIALFYIFTVPISYRISLLLGVAYTFALILLHNVDKEE